MEKKTKKEDAIILKNIFDFPKLSLLTTSSLFLLSFEIKKEYFTLKLFIIIFSFYAIYYIFKLIKNTIENYIFGTESSVLNLTLILENNWNNKIDLWEKFFKNEKKFNLTKEEKRIFIKLYLKQLEDLFNKVNNNKNNNFEGSELFKNFLKTYNNEEIILCKTKKTLESATNLTYSNDFFKLLINLYSKKIKNKYLEIILLNNYRLVLKNIFKEEKNINWHLSNLANIFNELIKNKANQLEPENNTSIKKYNFLINSFLKISLESVNFKIIYNDYNFQKNSKTWSLNNKISDRIIFQYFIFNYLFSNINKDINKNKTKKVLEFLFKEHKTRYIYNFIYFIFFFCTNTEIDYKNNIQFFESEVVPFNGSYNKDQYLSQYLSIITQRKEISFKTIKKIFLLFSQDIVNNILIKDKNFFNKDKNKEGKIKITNKIIIRIIKKWEENIIINKDDDKSIIKNKKEYKQMFLEFIDFLKKEKYICKK